LVALERAQREKQQNEQMQNKHIDRSIEVAIRKEISKNHGTLASHKLAMSRRKANQTPQEFLKFPSSMTKTAHLYMATSSNKAQRPASSSSETRASYPELARKNKAQQLREAKVSATTNANDSKSKLRRPGSAHPSRRPYAKRQLRPTSAASQISGTTVDDEVDAESILHDLPAPVENVKEEDYDQAEEQ
jgi:hypothetical protein